MRYNGLMPSILIVDDEPDILEITRWALEEGGYQVFTAANSQEAMETVRSSRPNIYLIDYRLKLITGIELLKQIREIDPVSPAIMITGLTHQTEPLEAECRRLGTVAFLKKPLGMDQIIKTVNQVTGKS